MTENISQYRSFAVTMEDSPWSVMMTVANGLVIVSMHWRDNTTPTHIRELDLGESRKFLEFCNAKDNPQREDNLRGSDEG